VSFIFLYPFFFEVLYPLLRVWLTRSDFRAVWINKWGQQNNKCQNRKFEL